MLKNNRTRSNDHSKFQIMKYIISLSILVYILSGCERKMENQDKNSKSQEEQYYFEGMYVPFTLQADLSVLSGQEKKMIPVLIEAADIMDEIFWHEAFGRGDSLLNQLEDPELKQFARINYGPWDRLNNNEPFIDGVGPKPAGANFYPADMTKEEFEASGAEDKRSLYTMIRRDERGNLEAIHYHEYFNEKILKASRLLEEAAGYAEDPGLKRYLELRAEAFRDDNYQESDLAWMDMTTNTIDVVIGPIETYEDQLYGYKAAHEAYVLIKDKAWSERLDRYAAFLPELQEALPVPAEYKQEKPGSDAQLNAYDVVYYAGDCNAGSKTIAINLPNDEEVQLKKGTRRLQLKNAMRAKFDKILVPIAQELIAPGQVDKISFDAFFSNTMFHEVAHGLGIKNTITGKGTVREALQEHASTIEESKADILGLYMIDKLSEKGEIDRALEDYYITFLAGIFRSIRFGTSSAHGKANMIRFNYFKEKNAFVRDPDDGKYRVNFENMQEAVRDLSREILVMQGDGDYQAVDRFMDEYVAMGDTLEKDLDRLKENNVPVDIVFEQGLEFLNL